MSEEALTIEERLEQAEADLCSMRPQVVPPWANGHPKIAGQYWQEFPDGGVYMTEITQQMVDEPNLEEWSKSRWSGPIPKPAEPKSTEDALKGETTK